MHTQHLLIRTILLMAAPVFLGAQWLNHPTPGIPRTAEGKPDLAARAPRTADGHPDLSGLWRSDSAPRDILARLLPGGNGDGGEDGGEGPSQYFLNLMEGVKPGESPLRPEAEAAYRKLTQNFTKDSPVSHCLPAGIPLVEYSPSPFKILQTPGLIVMLYEHDTTFRQVYTDGRTMPLDPSPMWMGYSVGRWDGDTLVLEVAGLADRSWLDVRGHTHSEALHLTERFRRADFGHMEEQITFEDAKTFTRPYTIKVQHHLQADTDLLESFCSENERDIVHIVGQ